MAMKKTSPRRGRERRGSERADARLSMRLEAGTAGAARIVTESQNISASGVYCHASHYLAPLSKVQLTIVLPRTPGDGSGQGLVKCDGIVVRCDQRPGVRSETPYELACMFTALDSSIRRRIEDFVTWRNLQALRAAMAPAPRAHKHAATGSARDGARKTAKPTAAIPTRSGGAAARTAAKSAAKPAARPAPGRARR